jgi:hypothetical protein
MIRFKAVAFEGKETAAKALDTLEENPDSDSAPVSAAG